MPSPVFLPTPVLPGRRESVFRRPVVTKSNEDAVGISFRLLPQRRSGPVKQPTRTTELNHNPEFFLAATAAVIFVFGRLAFRSAAGLFASLVARANSAQVARISAHRFVGKQKERHFLESAVLSTETTLRNTRAFLAAQEARLHAAEARISQLGVSRERLDIAAAEARHRKKILAEAEWAFETELQKLGSNSALLTTLELNLARTRKALSEYEETVRVEREELERGELIQREKFADARKETARLEYMLLEKELELKKEVARRDQFVESVAKAGRHLGTVSHTLAKTFRRLEDGREHLRKLETQKGVLREDASPPIAATEKLRRKGIEISLQQVQRHQENIRATLGNISFVEEKKIAEMQGLTIEVEKREDKLRKLRERLQIVQSAQHAPKRSPDDESGSGSPKFSGSQQVKNATLQATNSQSSTPAPSTEQPLKRRRGRPRKATAALLKAATASKPKRGRGRPRKLVSEGDVASGQVAKRKPGKPRKREISTVNTHQADS